jgi:hypothetical protein
VACSVLGLMAVAGPLVADSPEEHPGYFDLDALGILDADDSTVDVNLRGAMLRLVGAAVLNDEPALAGLVNDLVSMRVLVAELAGLDAEATAAAVEAAAERLDQKGWQRVVRVRESSEQVHLYVREVEGEVVGMTLLVIESEDEVTLVNMAGRIDPAQLMAIGQAFDIPTLEGALADQPTDPPPTQGQEEPPRRDRESSSFYHAPWHS